MVDKAALLTNAELCSLSEAFQEFGRLHCTDHADDWIVQHVFSEETASWLPTLEPAARAVYIALIPTWDGTARDLAAAATAAVA